MTKAEEKFLELLKNFIWLESSDMDGFTDWKELFELASMHHVYPLIYEQVCHEPQFLALAPETRAAARKKMLAGVTMQMKRTAAFLEVYETLLQGGVHPLVIKGLICRELYHKPDYRMSSDEDLLIRKEEFDACDRCLLAQGFERESLKEGDSLPQEVSYWNKKTSVYLEVHLELFVPKKDGKGRFADLNREFTAVFSHVKTQTVQGVNVLTMDDTTHFYYLFCHALKHFLHAGVGIRQLCDMLLMAQRYENSIDWKFLKARMERLEILQFFKSLMEIGKKYLGFCCKKMEEIMGTVEKVECEELLADMLGGGIYGASSAARIHSANMTLAAAENRSGFWASLFPEKDYMHHQYPFLDRHPRLLWAAYVQRIFIYQKKIRQARKRESVEKTDSIRMGKRRIQMMKKYGIVD